MLSGSRNDTSTPATVIKGVRSKSRKVGDPSALRKSPESPTRNFSVIVITPDDWGCNDVSIGNGGSRAHLHQALAYHNLWETTLAPEKASLHRVTDFLRHSAS